jgi:hypothetical protein
MRNFILTTSDKEIFVEAEWLEQAVTYFKWVSSYDGNVTAREIPCCTAVVDFYCPAGWNVPISSESELARNRAEWLKNYLGKFYEVYRNGKETPEFIEFMKNKGWKREFPYYANDMDAIDDPFPDAGYTNPELAWGKYPITIQGIEGKTMKK